MDNIITIKGKKYRIDHTAYKRGYMSRKCTSIPSKAVAAGQITPYEGRFGNGYTVETPAFNTTRYHWITYLLEV